MTENTTSLTAQEDDALDAFFAAARASEPAPDSVLLGRILTDAQTHLPAPRISILQRIRRALEPVGGYAGMTALAACAVFGLGVGYAGTGGIDTLLEPVSQASFDPDVAVEYFDLGTTGFDALEG